MQGNLNRGAFLPANGRLAVCRPLSRGQGLPYLCLRKPQGQPADLEILGKLANFLQINALLAADYLLGFYNCDREWSKISARFP